MILCSFRLILEGNGGKEIHQMQKNSTSGPLYIGGIADLFLENTTTVAISQRSCEVRSCYIEGYIHLFQPGPTQKMQ